MFKLALVLLGVIVAADGFKTRSLIRRIAPICGSESIVPESVKTIPSSSCEDTCNTCVSNGTVSLQFTPPVGQPTPAELTDENIVQIVSRLDEVSDQECNRFVWRCLGYDYNLNTDSWSGTRVFPKWLSKFPTPPDLVGVTRNFSPEVDKEVRQASMDLMRSIPRDFKGGVRNLEATTGFRGFKLSELTPTKTRRAQLVNWLIYYRYCGTRGCRRVCSDASWIVGRSCMGRRSSSCGRSERGSRPRRRLKRRFPPSSSSRPSDLTNKQTRDAARSRRIH